MREKKRVGGPHSHTLGRSTKSSRKVSKANMAYLHRETGSNDSLLNNIGNITELNAMIRFRTTQNLEEPFSI